MPRAEVSFKDWVRFFLPILKDNEISSLILYKDNRAFTGDIVIRTFIDGFEIVTRRAWNSIVEEYENQETSIGINGPPPEISDDELLNKFNQDYMDGRGIPEV